MSNPKELHENTRLDYKSYPLQVFHNVCSNANMKNCILYLHWHEHFEIICMRQGHAVFHIDTTPYHVKTGEVLIIPGGSLHVGYALEDGDVRFDCLVVNASLFNEFLHDPIHARYVAPFLEGRLRFPAKPAESEPACVDHYPLLEEIIAELDARRPAYQLIAKTKLYTFFVQLSRICLPTSHAEKSTEPYFVNRDRYKQLIHRIETQIGEKLTVEEAAAQIGLNPFHFCKMFKRLTGRTFVDFVNLTRMNAAEKLLGEMELTITEIAGKVGCSNPNYFTKLYKQYKGMTPSQARS
ncbi:AraC family transcriptional regulator [Paenibacillus sp. JCM 10914]|uniref:helix-turn-helix transcriptional regulator n=1 Tax=Paenibacillus sp. JCM 10914 TaxID=1236974 RepID=UPI0003CC8E8D|nr:AraC family transcriptional regulator [Paenibacillus sp. JCM 10914]GAE08339.1 two-component response regulator [Paenibacillus sp. JCM 10914]